MSPRRRSRERFSDTNWETLRGGRAALLVKPTDALSLDAGILYQSIHQGGPNTIDVPPGNDVHYQPFDVSEPFEDNFNLYTFTAKYDFDGFQIVSATSDWTRHQLQTQDISEAMQDYIGGFLGPPADFPFSTADGGLGAGSISEDDYSRQVSEELRVASTGNGPWQWLGGAYYSSFHATSHVYSYYEGFTRAVRYQQPGRQPPPAEHRPVRAVRRDLVRDARPPEVDHRVTLLHLPQRFGDLRQRRVGQRHERHAATPTRRTPE